MGRRLRKRPIAASALATAIAAIAVLLIAWVTGADAVGRAFADFHPGWIALIAGAEILAYPAYMIAYRSLAGVHGHRQLSLPIVARVVVAGFGPFAVGGGFGIDKQALHALDEDERSARVRVIGLGVLEWALLAPTASVIAIVFLITGEDIAPRCCGPGRSPCPWASASGSGRARPAGASASRACAAAGATCWRACSTAWASCTR